jgi:Protein of unknown function (DUF2971)
MDPELQAGVQEFTDWWEEQQRQASIADEVITPLFHYTNAAGLQGIINSNELWLSGLFHMNDPSELAYGIEVALEELDKATQNAHKPILLMRDCMRDVLINHVGEIFGFFVGSFSTKDDDLGQWRAYGDNGRGFSLGLAPRLFQTADVPDPTKLPINERFTIARVKYDKPEFHNRQRTAINLALGIASKLQSKLTMDFLKSLSVQLAVSILWNSLTTKHPAYASEDEVRLILLNDMDKLRGFVKTRARGNQLVPYVPIPFAVREPGSIARIVIGPANAHSASDVRDAVWHLLSKFIDEPNPLIVDSDIPYRT